MKNCFKHIKSNRIFLLWLVLVVIITSVNTGLLAFADDTEESFSVGAYTRIGTSNSFRFETPVGTGTAEYCSMTVSYSLRPYSNESINLPNVEGYTENTIASTDMSKSINFPSGKTASQIANEYFKYIEFTDVAGGQQIRVSLEEGAASEYTTIYYAPNDHYYQYIPFEVGENGSTDNKWTTAYDLAKTMTYKGRTGYLATVTSMDEDLYITKAATHVGWLAGTRLNRTGEVFNDVEDITDADIASMKGDGTSADFDISQTRNGSVWYWACGPEAGTPFYVTAGGGVSQESTKPNYYETMDEENKAKTYINAEGEEVNYYFNWERYRDKEPNASWGSEACISTLALSNGEGYSTGKGYSWNDLDPINPYNDPRDQAWTIRGFFVEYGDKEIGNTPPSPSDPSTTQTLDTEAVIRAPLPEWAEDTGSNTGFFDNGGNDYNATWEPRDYTLTLKDDVTLSETIELPADATAYFDMMNHNITAPALKPAISIEESQSTDNQVRLDIKGPGSIIVTDGEEDNIPAIDFSNAVDGSIVRVAEVDAPSTATIGYKVFLELNDGTLIGTAYPQYYICGVEKALPTAATDSASGTVSKDEYIFAGWYATEDFTGDAVSTISVDAAGNQTFYARWGRLLTVINGSGSGTFTSGTSVTMTAATPPVGQRFKEWDISPDVVFDEGSSKTTSTVTFTMPDSAVTATAVFEDDGSITPPVTTALLYKANGGTGEEFSEEGNVNDTVMVSNNPFSREGYSFAGWNTSADGAGTAYPIGSKYTLTENEDILYAQWTKNSSGATKDEDGNKLHKVPQTGDTKAFALWFVVILVCGVGTIVMKKRTKIK